MGSIEKIHEMLVSKSVHVPSLQKAILMKSKKLTASLTHMLM